MRRIVDTTATPVYQHFITDGAGTFLFLKYSFFDDADPRYIELLEIQKKERTEYSKGIWQATPDKRKEMLSRPLPAAMSWRSGITSILPQNKTSDTSGIRKKKLKKRLEKRAPLFAEELFNRELEEQKEYFSCESEFDRMKQTAREEHTKEYWKAYHLAEVGFCVSII